MKYQNYLHCVNVESTFKTKDKEKTTCYITIFFNTTAVSVKCLYINMTVLSLPLRQSNRDTQYDTIFYHFCLRS